MKITLIFLLLALAFTGCYYDNEEELYPNPPECDTTNVTFSGTILPIITDNCKACHGSGSQQGGVLLEDYASISAAANIPPGQYGSLYGAVSHDPGNSPMPKGGTQLSDCNIRKIKTWIDAGTPNN
jgi:hypothetical protein